ncbi:YagK/YfjJ domain-containing protein [Lysobacter soyae]|uniref:Inovirus Gp2 family protein n=1 Tax=Lysobacter soyae TaxID=2764185 RepID=A0ABX8WMK5_9GAMM|nr:inovirus-type Gp2 protein [Lysobacter sp. CJ11]QYR52872.1 inovirus Gp2 family protein [Lysobacter sp. CJ11]
MNKNKKRLLKIWRLHTRVPLDHGWIISKEMNCPRILLESDHLIDSLAKARGGYQFSVVETTRGPRVRSTPLLKNLVVAINSLNASEVRACFPHHSFSKYFELWESAVSTVPVRRPAEIRVQDVEAMNAWIMEVRARAKNEGYTAAVRNERRAAHKNYVGLRKYVDRLFERHARLLVIRLDLGYVADPFPPASTGSLPVVQANVDFKRFLAQLVAQYPAMVGYAWKKEWGVLKGPHMHLLLFFNGHVVREDYTIGHALGDLWKRVASFGASYWLSNADKLTLETKGKLGIGMIDYRDSELREGLKDVCMYLTKMDLYVRMKIPGLRRVFGKGQIRGRSSKRGRPRLLLPIIQEEI